LVQKGAAAQEPAFEYAIAVPEGQIGRRYYFTDCSANRNLSLASQAIIKAFGQSFLERIVVSKGNAFGRRPQSAKHFIVRKDQERFGKPYQGVFQVRSTQRIGKSVEKQGMIL